MSSNRWVLYLLGVALGIPSLNGCGKPATPKRYAVQGRVTLDKKPLEKGVIYFKIVESGELNTFQIQNGEFAGELGEGERRVEIVSYVSRGERDIGGMKGEFQENLIPAHYNIDSKITATVTPTGPNQFVFDLVSR
ncbi:MAG: hypothetical protein C0467_25410 [Planctomycetaceae bacterium]|nr:hypothetical protein [Planctomycetaceae bacterium]